MEKKSKTVRMNPGVNPAGSANQPEKLTYEQLEKVAMDLNMQCRQLQNQLNNAQRVMNEFNDLGMLLNIVTVGENFSSDFIVRCTNRIEAVVSKALDNYDRMEAEKQKDDAKSND